jgi:hypothetical protein
MAQTDVGKRSWGGIILQADQSVDTFPALGERIARAGTAFSCRYRFQLKSQ